MHIIHNTIGEPTISVKKIDDTHALFTISPLPLGFGMTLGNTLRRILLSSLPGSAVTAVSMRGASHEYSVLSGVADSVLDQLLNLKLLRVSSTSEGPVTMTLNKKTPGPVKAKDIDPTGEITILNPELVITNLEKGAKLELDITIEKGVGYAPAANRQSKNKQHGLIFLDANFSPVERVRYDVSSARVGALTNLDKLEVEVKTSGSMSPEDAMTFAANIAQNYFALFSKPEPVEPAFVANATGKEEKEEAASADASSEDATTAEGDDGQEKYTPIEILGFSPRTLNALINGGIGSIEQLSKCPKEKLVGLRGLGEKAVVEIEERLKEKGVTLNEEEA